MEDERIIELYWARSEDAISETSNKYGSYCRQIAWNILYSSEDSEECVNDTYLRVWNTIPPHKPNKFSAFLGRITRNLALDRYKKLTADKRGNGQVTLALDELAECIPSADNTESAADDIALTDVLNRFLASLPAEKRKIFMRRYWYLSRIKEIAADFGMSESKVKMILMRTRNELKEILEKEGIVL